MDKKFLLLLGFAYGVTLTLFFAHNAIKALNTTVLHEHLNLANSEKYVTNIRLTAG